MVALIVIGIILAVVVLVVVPSIPRAHLVRSQPVFTTGLAIAADKYPNEGIGLRNFADSMQISSDNLVNFML